MTDETLTALASPHPWVAYAHTHGTNGLLEHLWDRIAKLEAQLASAENRIASDALAASYSRGGGHGF